jgi:hypothetical protein
VTQDLAIDQSENFIPALSWDCTESSFWSVESLPELDLQLLLNALKSQNITHCRSRDVVCGVEKFNCRPENTMSENSTTTTTHSPFLRKEGLTFKLREKRESVCRFKEYQE